MKRLVIILGLLGVSQTLAAQRASVYGTVYVDRNANGRRDAGEPGIGGVAVSDQRSVAVSDANGLYRLPESDGSFSGLIFVSVPDGYAAVGPFYRSAPATTITAVDFGLRSAPAARSFTFVHASDTHIAPATRARTIRLRALVDSVKPDFVIITGDLVRDALRVGETEATGYFDLFAAEAALVSVPLYTVPGNHENFGIERDKSGVSATHPLYGRAMYRSRRGPDYYSFNRGGVHFVALNSVDIDDTRYYGHVDSLQLAWLTADLAAIPASMPVVTFNHIPFYSAIDGVNGYTDAPPAPTLITVNGKTAFRHTVSNARDVLARLAGHTYPLALAGHVHVREQLRFTGLATRFDQVSAVVAPTTGPGTSFTSGITVYRVTSRTISDGVFVPLGLDTIPTRR
jgi:predicted MPP superfamily phosphohydrolase